MKTPFLMLTCAVLLTLNTTSSALELKTDKQRLSYAMGQMAAKSMALEGVELDTDIVLQSLRDGLTGSKPLLEMTEVIAEINKARQAKARVRQQAALDNLKKGEDFLRENAKKDGVVTLPSGLQYRVITQGKGKIPGPTDTVETHYRGTLIDGTQFDSSYDRGKPASFPVNRVIAGWTEALQLMPVGSKWQLFIPAKLAYGSRGQGKIIKGNSALIFDIELLAIK